MKRLLDFSITVNEEILLKELKNDFKIPPWQIRKRYRKTILEFIKVSKPWIKPKAVYEILSCRTYKNQIIFEGGKGILTGSSLVKVLGKNKKVGLFVVTIGDELEKKLPLFEPLHQLIIEAIGSAATEECAEYIHHQVIDSLLKENEKQITIRLSPEWGAHKGIQDWRITDQKIIFEILKPELIGAILTPNYMMLPRKSISAIVGIKKPTKN